MERPHLFTLEDNNKIANVISKSSPKLLGQFYDIYNHNFAQMYSFLRWAMWPMGLLSHSRATKTNGERDEINILILIRLTCALCLDDPKSKQKKKELHQFHHILNKNKLILPYLIWQVVIVHIHCTISYSHDISQLKISLMTIKFNKYMQWQTLWLLFGLVIIKIKHFVQPLMIQKNFVANFMVYRT